MTHDDLDQRFRSAHGRYAIPPESRAVLTENDRSVNILVVAIPVAVVVLVGLISWLVGVLT